MLAFAMTYCSRDKQLAQDSSAALKTLYPQAQVLLIEDNPRLKLPQFSGQWTERWMKQALTTGADIIVKVDPDTRALAAVTNWPITDIFGQVSPDKTYHNLTGVLYGAAIGFKASTVKKILDSGQLRHPRYKQPPFVTRETRYTPVEFISLQDPIVHDIAVRLKLAEGPWPGIFIQPHWETPAIPPPNTTFVHPVRGK